ncbi:MAG: hypothetical protein K8963_07680, partial [Proteobacteria bacterium]|nr:hypothetical protein [Pseudomonadota bacterium]
MAISSKTRSRYEELQVELSRHSELYHGQDSPEISDAEYDRLFHEAKDIERDHPELKTADSASNKVGTDAQQRFPRKAHTEPMLSLKNGFKKSEVEKFAEDICKRINKEFRERGVADGLEYSLAAEEDLSGRRGETEGAAPDASAAQGKSLSNSGVGEQNGKTPSPELAPLKQLGLLDSTAPATSPPVSQPSDDSKVESIKTKAEPNPEDMMLGLIYRNGKFGAAQLRGDSVEGTVVIDNAHFIEGIPKYVEAFEKFKRVEIRGEVIGAIKELTGVQKQPHQTGDATSKRGNLTAGRGRFIPCFYARTVIGLKQLGLKDQSEAPEFLTKCGFTYTLDGMKLGLT